jgi:L-lactate dehydrogenase (cytochrome)
VRIDQCNSIRDFRLMARRRLPGPIFHYIDGAADDDQIRMFADFLDHLGQYPDW